MYAVLSAAYLSPAQRTRSHVDFARLAGAVPQDAFLGKRHQTKCNVIIYDKSLGNLVGTFDSTVQY